MKWPIEEKNERIGQIGNHINKWDNGLYLTGEIYGVSIDFLIDTGSTASLLSCNLYNVALKDENVRKRESESSTTDHACTSTFPTKALQELPENGGKLQNVSGIDLSIHGVMNAEIFIGDDTFEQKFVICDMSPDAILGQDFLLKYVRKIDYQTKVLKTDDNDIGCWIGGEFQMTCRVLAKETTVLPSNSINILPVNIPNIERVTSLAVIEPSDQLYLTKNVSIVSGIIDRNQESPLIEIINYSNSDITLYPNTLLGSCEPINGEPNPFTDRCAAISTNADTTNPDKSSIAETEVPDHLTDLFERSSTLLQPHEIEIMKALLIQYKTVFSRSSEDIGRTNRVKHKIDTGNARPIRVPPRRLPIGKRDTEKQEISKLIERGIIRPSNSPWCAPLVLVTKPDKTTRICVDLRALNSVTKRDAYPLPRVDDCLEALSNSVWYNQMDLHSGFWQIELDEIDREKTAFSTSLGLFEFTVMPFGAVNSPSTFERLMEDVLRGLQWVECLLYMDDIIVPGSSFEVCITRLEHVFERLLQANLKLKASKCIFFQKRVKFLGHIISEEGISTDPEKIKAVKEWPVLTTVKQVRSFLGLASYYRRFVAGYAKIARPLHRLCEKGTRFVWSPECQTAFETLKEALITSPMLAYPIPNQPFILDTDASQFSVGSIIAQEVDGKEYVIAYMSKALNRAEQSYCVTRKELLAVVVSLKHFHSYLYGQQVLLRTDNAAVSWMRNLKRPTGQTARWLQELGTYDLTIIHRPGQKHTNADALSRVPCKSCLNQQTQSESTDTDEEEPPQESECEEAVPLVRAVTRSRLAVESKDKMKEKDIILEGWDSQTMRQNQLNDPDISDILTWTENKQYPEWSQISDRSSTLKTLWRQWDRLKLFDGVLYRTWVENEDRDQLQLIVPQMKREDAIKLYHDIPSAAHLGIDKTVEKLQRSFYWPAMRSSVSEYIHACDFCSANKQNQASKAHMGQFIVGEPMERVAMDILGPLPLSKNGNRYILVLADLFTKWTEAYPIPNQEAKTIAKTFLNGFVCKFGTPLQLYTDQGSNFESEVLQELCKILQIEKTRSTSMHPQANGCVERFNRTLISMMKMYCQENQDSWDENLPQLLMAYRSSKHASTGFTPNHMMLGREITLPIKAFIPEPETEKSSVNEFVETLQKNLVKTHAHARNNLKKSNEYQKRQYDQAAKKRELKPGQAVWLYDPSRKKGICSKLLPKWKGPFTVIRKIDDLVYMIKRSRRQPAKIYHIDRLVLYNGNNKPIWYREREKQGLAGNKEKEN